jgi:hypothetical protein
MPVVKSGEFTPLVISTELLTSLVQRFQVFQPQSLAGAHEKDPGNVSVRWMVRSEARGFIL